MAAMIIEKTGVEWYSVHCSHVVVSAEVIKLHLHAAASARLSIVVSTHGITQHTKQHQQHRPPHYATSIRCLRELSLQTVALLLTVTEDIYSVNCRTLKLKAVGWQFVFWNSTSQKCDIKRLIS